MQIDFISDTICPWCFIGKRRLNRAIAMRPNILFDVRFRPYRLDPSVPRQGVDRAQYLAARFGADGKLEEAHAAIAAEGAKEDIVFNWAAIRKTPNTADSHRLIGWAEAQGVQDDVVERLFIAYFENGEVIGDIKVLSRHRGPVRHGRHRRSLTCWKATPMWRWWSAKTRWREKWALRACLR